MTKERPILFRASMVRALLDGTKAQTRRVVKCDFDIMGERDDGTLWPWREDFENGGDYWYPCPYGQPGDLLWVRETFGYGCRPDPFEGAVDGIEYRADEDYIDDIESLPLYRPKTPDDFCYGDITRSGWRPSIHMPRWASRITLRIKSVRVERLNQISRGDAMAEGCPFPNMAHETDPIGWYAALWESINGAGSWDKNPWVWVVEFEVVK